MPTLFKLFLEIIIRETLKEHNTSHYTVRNTVCKLSFADDIDDKEDSYKELQDKLVERVVAYGMKYNKEKPKVVIIAQGTLVTTSSWTANHDTMDLTHYTA